MPEKGIYRLIYEKIRTLAGRKLEEKALELVDLPLGKTSPDILEYIRIAEEQGFAGALYLLKEIVYELGIAQIKNSLKQKRKLSHKEKDLEDFLAKSSCLDEIETGLSYNGRQKKVASGILDLSAHDIQGKPVNLELKMDDYTSKHVFWQIMKYLNEKEDERFIFIAPQIKPDLFYPLKPYLQSGRISFFEVSELEKGYTFRKITEENLCNHGKRAIDFNTRERESEILTVIKAEKDISWTEWEKQPFFYQILQLTRPNLKNKKQYLKQKSIGEEQKNDLENLVLLPGTEHALKRYKSQAKWFIPYHNLEAQIKNFRQIKIDTDYYKKIYRAEKREADMISRFTGLQIKAYSMLESFMFDSGLYEETMGLLKQVEKEAHEVLAFTLYHDEGSKAMRQVIINILKEPISENYEKYLRGLYFYTSGIHLETLECILRAKIERTEALMKVDQELAFTYLGFHPVFNILLDVAKEGKDYRKTNIDIITYDQIYAFIMQDNALYQSILSHFKADRKIIQKYETIDKVEIHTPVKIQEPLKSLSDAINPAKNGEIFAPDTKSRISYFTEDVLNAGLSPELEQQLYDSFIHFNLARKMRNRQTRKNELQIRNFFDDITLKYILKGKVPKKEDLEYLYEKSRF